MRSCERHRCSRALLTGLCLSKQSFKNHWLNNASPVSSRLAKVASRCHCVTLPTDYKNGFRPLESHPACSRDRTELCGMLHTISTDYGRAAVFVQLETVCSDAEVKDLPPVSFSRFVWK